MNNKRMKGDINNITGEKINRYSIRKVSFGAASVAVTALFMFWEGQVLRHKTITLQT